MKTSTELTEENKEAIVSALESCLVDVLVSAPEAHWLAQALRATMPRPMSEAPRRFLGALRGKHVLCAESSSPDHHERSFWIVGTGLSADHVHSEKVFASELDGWWPLPPMPEKP